MGGAQPDGSEPLIARAFGREDITSLRHAVVAAVRSVGMTGRPMEDFVLALNEITTNAVEHGGGKGHLVLWLDDDGLVCEISDDGVGLPAERLADAAAPPPSAIRGRGLWLARQLCAAVTVRERADGTTVRLSVRLPVRGCRA